MTDDLNPPAAATIAPPPFSATRAALFAVGVGVPFLTTLFFFDAMSALFACMGALTALQTDPRRSQRWRVGGIVFAQVAIVGAAAVGVALAADRRVEAVLVVFIAFVAGLPRPAYPYLTLVGKIAAAAVVVTSAGLDADRAAALAFVGGGLFALAATLAEGRLRGVRDAGTSPRDEWRAIWAGMTNPLPYAATLAAATGAALLLAYALNAHLPGWVGLTVLFVMHPDQVTGIRLIAQRVGGTLVAIAIAALLLHMAGSQWVLAVIAVGCAALIPAATARSYFWMSATFTLLVMLVLDIALLPKGGDAALLLWRFYDTVLGCLVAAAAMGMRNLAYRFRTR